MDKHLVSVDDFRLRPALEVDAGLLYSWFNSPREMADWGGPGFTYPMSSDAFLQALKISSLRSFWLCDRSDRIVGFGQFYVRLGNHHLGRLTVHPEHRGHGLGTVLVKKLIKQAPKSQTAENFSLFVMKDNTAARRCYHRIGFRDEDYPGDIPGDLSDCLYMVFESK